MGPVSLMAAMGLGIAHALAPGHGKTLMAAYLVSRGGKARHAAVLGLSVAVSHTLGVAVLGVATLVAANTFRPERVYPWLSGVSAIVITVIGVTMLGRVMTGSGRHQPGVDHDQGDHDHDHGHSHDHDHDHGHSHQPQVTGWRSMVGLGLAGGLVPSASAVILLLAGIGSGRPALGLVMVLFFGLGMSLALVGAGLAVVGLYRWGVGRFRGEGSRRIRRLTPALAAFAVTGVGLFLLMDVIRAV
jgi:ABC-type nickel/cobalt efflux system permease component RcnA